MRALWICLVASLVLLPSLAVRAESGPFVVVANPSVGAVDASTLRALYLKNRSEWPSGVEARPLRLAASSAGQEAFRESVLGMSEAELSRHWLSVKQRTGQIPPREARSARAVLLLVSRIPGAFGVVEADLVPEDGSVAVVLRLP